jgi:outer membrane protein TolC
MSSTWVLTASCTTILLLAVTGRAWADEPANPRWLTPDQAVAVALQNSPVLGGSVAQARQSRWALTSELTKFDPTLILDAGVTRSQSPSLSMAGTAVPRMDTASIGAELKKKLSLGTDLSLRVAGSWQQTQMAAMPGQSDLLTMGPGYGLSAKLGVTQPLLRGAGSEVNRTSILASEADRKAATHAEQLAAATLARDTLNAYAELWYASRNVTVQTKSLEVATGQRDDAALRERTGSVAQADVLSFETTVATRQESVMDAGKEQSSKRLELLRIMGSAADFTLIDELSVPASEQGDLVAEALANSDELRQLEASLEAATIRARTVADPQRSRLDLDAYMQVQGLGNKEVYPAFSQLVGGSAWSAHVGLTYELPISGKLEAEVRKAAAGVEAAQKNLLAARARIRTEVETLVLQERVARSRAELAERTVAIARQAADAQRARMQTGSSTALQVIEAENQVRSAELRALRATVDGFEAVIALRRVTGRLVQYTASR